ncbi:Shikimate 5-dehydrogenase I alpha [hydrothermal vent metagenome]|uniref:shikimate dehydrogenase (NADP(+)) n=1 Tax=hydrothermal vent metagenome TaxID=652676 RepID=A0A3B0Z8S0_9ZZZZ
MSKDYYAVMGNPVAHSKSPQIHTLFAAQTAARLSYEAILVATDGFNTAVSDFQNSGGKGLNITVPFKQEAWHLANKRSDRAKLAGAVNTLIIKNDGELYGENTDGQGLVTDLINNHNIEIQSAKILVIGAGGAVRGVLAPLLANNPQTITIVNRTMSRAAELAQVFSSLGSINVCSFTELAGQNFDLIINGSAASLHGEVPPLPVSIINQDCCCYDMMYGDKPTPFMVWAKEQGAKKTIDGLGMLVEQAAESFYLWRGIHPATAEVIAEIRGKL